MKRKSLSLYFSMPIIYIGIVLTLLLDVVVYRQLEMVEQNQTRELGNAHLAWVSQSIERYVNIADGMVSYVMREGGSPDNMSERAGQYFALSPELCSIQLAPGGEVSKAYPWEKDRIDLSKIISQTKSWESDTISRQQRPALTTLIDKDSGEKDMAFIRPVYLWNEGNQGHFWGFVVIDVSLSRMLERLDLYSLGSVGLRYRLCWKNTENGEEVLIANNGLITGESVHVARGVGGELWTLYLQPVNGWGNPWMVAMLTWIGLTVTGLFSFYRSRVNRIRRQGEVDALTGAYNRKGGDRAVAEFLRQPETKKVAVITLDVDNFKLVNDVYGHDTGDKVLQQLVSDIRETFGEPLILTRNGGDEFVVVKGYEEENWLLDRIRLFTEMAHKVMYREKEVEFHTSVGYALYPEQDTVYKSLCVKADFALYNAKLNGKSDFRKFDESLLDMQERFQLGFNLSDMTNHMPGAMMVYRADDTRKILFASDQIIHLFQCNNWEDFMEYAKGTVNTFVSEEDKKRMAKERKHLIAISQGDKDIDIMDMKVRTKRGVWKDVIVTGNYNVNNFHGGVVYASLFERDHLRRVYHRDL